jgi:hypothetical protein
MCTEDSWPGCDGASGGGEPPGAVTGAGPVGGPPRTAAEALAMMDAALDFLNGEFLAGPGGAGLDSAGLAGADLGSVLEALGGLSGKFAAARSAILARFDAARGHDADGYGSSAAWLAAMGRTTRRAANAEVRRMRQFRAHPVVAAAVARGELSEAWAAEIAEWTRRLPASWRDDVDRLLVDTALAGAELADLAVVAQAAYEKWRQQQGPDDDDGDGGFGDRYLKLATTIDGAGRVGGDLTPECAASLQAVLEALGKKAGPDDDRTEGQRFHDALQLACQLLLRADLAPDRAGADARLDGVISLAELLRLSGASELQESWLAALAGQPGYLAGRDAEVVACDAVISPVVTGSPDVTVVDEMIGVILACLDDTADGEPVGGEPAGGSTGDIGTGHGGPGSAGQDGDGGNSTGGGTAAARSRALSPEAWQALRYAIVRLAVDLVSGPDRLASILRRGLLEAPYTSKSVILDVGLSASIPGHIRRAVQLRARGCCEWPGCGKQAVYCDVHHLRHQADGGETSVNNCVLLCQFHHDICIHRKGWRLILHPDATTTAYGPHGQVLHSHAPPGDKGPPGGADSPADTGPP